MRRSRVRVLVSLTIISPSSTPVDDSETVIAVAPAVKSVNETIVSAKEIIIGERPPAHRPRGHLPPAIVAARRRNRAVPAGHAPRLRRAPSRRRVLTAGRTRSAPLALRQWGSPSTPLWPETPAAPR